MTYENKAFFKLHSFKLKLRALHIHIIESDETITLLHFSSFFSVYALHKSYIFSVPFINKSINKSININIHDYLLGNERLVDMTLYLMQYGMSLSAHDTYEPIALLDENLEWISFRFIF